MSRNKFVWLLESSRSGYAMAVFETEELALEELEAKRDRLVKRWKDLGGEAGSTEHIWKHEVTEIDNGSFSVMDDIYTIHRHTVQQRNQKENI